MTSPTRTDRDPYAEHRLARHIANTARRSMDRAELSRLASSPTGPPTYGLEDLAGLVIVNTRPPGVRRPAWALWCGYVALTGRRPPAWWERLTRAPR